MLFLVWLAASFVVVGFINLYLRYFGLPRGNNQASISGQSYTGVGSGDGGCVDSGGWLGRRKSQDVGGEPVTWLTSSVAWLHHKCSQTPDFVDAWLRALTQEVERIQLQQQTGVLPAPSSQVQLRFDGVHGPPPEFHAIKSDTTSAEQLTLISSVSARDVTLQLCCFMINPTSNSAPTTPSPSSEAVNCDAKIQWIKGKIKLVIKLINNELSLSVSFLQPPDVRIQVRTIRPNSHVDVATLESLVRQAVTSATTTISWTSSRSSPHGPAQYAPHGATQSSPLSLARQTHDNTTRDLNPATAQMRSQSFYRNRDPIIPSTQSDLAYHSPSSLQTPPSSPVSSSYQVQQLTQQLPIQSQQQQQLLQQQQNYGQDNGLQRIGQSNQHGLLVKIIKANGLVDTEWGSCNAYCLVKLDHPVQSFMTNVIRNTVNPLWDEQFVFDIDAQSKNIYFEVLDRDKQPDNDVLGKASVILDEIRRMPSARQIIPLTGRPRSRTATSGSVTVELIFLDSLTHVSAQQGLYPQLQASAASNSRAVQQQQPGYGTGLLDTKTGQFNAGSPKLLANQPTFLVTGSEPQSHTLQAHQSAGGYRATAGLQGKDKKDGFAATLKKKFAFKKGGRAQSVDRYQSSSLRETSYLRPPPTHPTDFNRLAASDDTHVLYGDQRRDRSNSFGSSIKKIFKRDKKMTSRDNFLSRPTPAGAASTVGAKGDMPQYGTGSRFQREGTPVPPPGRQDYPPGGGSPQNTSHGALVQTATTPVREY